MNSISYPIWLLLFTTTIFLGCRPSKGPVFVNTSGQSAKIIAYYDDGHSIIMEWPNGILIWSGYIGGTITQVTVQLNQSSYSLQNNDLNTPLTGDQWAAFALTTSGLKKIKYSEAIGLAHN